MVPRLASRRRVLLGTACLSLAVVSGAVFGRDLLLRRSGVRVLAELGLAGRPEVVESLALCEAGDLAAAFSAETALAELAFGSASRGAAERYEARGKSGLASARDLAVRAVEERPGSASHRLLLARAGFAVWDLEARPEPGSAGRWIEAFRAAGMSAPGLDMTWALAADACVAAWPRLSPREREDAAPILRGAFRSGAYVRRAFPGAWRAIGARAAEFLPDSGASLKEGATALRAMGEPGAADALERRNGKVRSGAGD
jgi:hypothetical protein